MAGMIPLAFALIGFTSIVSQIVLLRELFVVFYGNELSVGAILAGWLLWVAAGSWILPMIRHRVSPRNPMSLFLILQAATILVLPVELFLVPNIRTLAGAVPGEIIGFFPMLAWSLVTLAPLCLLVGWQFTAACDASTSLSTAPRYSAGQVYLFESLGSVAGGLLANYILLYQFDAWQIALALGALNLFSALLQAGRRWLPAVVLLLIALPVLPIAASNLRAASLAQLWQGYNLVESRDSIYGNLAVTTRGGQYSFFENGLLLVTTEDFLAAEETAHYPLLQHPQPKRVLLIGGGINGTVREILKHPVAQVDYVELDPLIIATARRYLPPSDRQALDDPRVVIHNLDGRLFVREQQVRAEKYDVVLLNVPHPFTAQVNRLYTREFFAEVRQILRDDGLFSMVFISSENFASREMQSLDASVYRTLRDVFTDVLILPGDDAFLIASPRAGVLTRDVVAIVKRWDARKLQTAILTPSHLEQRLNPERIEYGQRVFDQPAALNRDLEPISLYLDLTLWASYFSGLLRDTMNAALQWRAYWLLPLLAVMGAGVAVFWRARSHRPLTAIVWTLAALGFAGMVWEVTLVFAFQVLHGYVYHEIALMMAAFMAGLALGSAWATRTTAAWRWLLAIEIAAVIYSLLLPLALALLQAAPVGTPQITLPALIAVGGLLVGAAFPVASGLTSPHSPNPLSPPLPGEERGGKGVRGEEVGALYAADLLGAAIGALLAGALLIPVLGLAQTALIVALLNTGGMLTLIAVMRGVASHAP